MIRSASCAALAALVACAAPPSPPPEAPPIPAAPRHAAPRVAPLDHAAPAEAGVDAAALANLEQRAADARSDALVVLRDGKLVYENHFGRGDGRIETMSMTKTIVALVFGRLVDTRRVASIDEPVWKWFPEWKQGKKQRITVRHLLEMTSGLQADKTTEEIYASPDFVRLALAAELVSDPGERFFYNNKAVNLLTAIAQRAANKPFDEIARAEVFAPLGITDVEWVHDKAGNAHGMSGLRLRPIDVAKLGQLMLDHGRAHGASIVSAAWIDAMTTPTKANASYGLLTWIDYQASFVLDDRCFDAWKAAKLEPEFIAKIRPLKDHVYEPTDDLFVDIAKAIGGERPLEVWYDHTWRRGLPDATAVDKRQVGYHMDGWLGQFVVVVPEERLVAVRMRRNRDGEGDDPRFDFVDFPKRARALVSP
ncbi:MAG TPA: serine hydrolase domain-containing protein [Byssovorax sp.]